MKYLILILSLLILVCSKNQPTENTIIVHDKSFDLELNTWSADRIVFSNVFADKISVETERYNQNHSEESFEANESLLRGIVLYQVLSDTVAILGFGWGHIIDGFGNIKETVYPNEIYKHRSRIANIDLLEYATIYYFNFWYKYEDGYEISEMINTIDPMFKVMVE